MEKKTKAQEGAKIQIRTCTKMVCVCVCFWKLWLFLYALLHRILGRQPFFLKLQDFTPYLFLSLSLFSIFFSYSSFSPCRGCMPQLRWNSVDVISTALLETSTSSQTGLGWLGERIKSSISRPKRFQFETEDLASHLTHWGTFNWMHSIQFRYGKEQGEQTVVKDG